MKNLRKEPSYNNNIMYDNVASSYDSDEENINCDMTTMMN